MHIAYMRGSVYSLNREGKLCRPKGKNRSMLYSVHTEPLGCSTFHIELGSCQCSGQTRMSFKASIRSNLVLSAPPCSAMRQTASSNEV